MPLLLSLFACAPAEHRTADAGEPITPDLGSLYDPRMAGCTANQDAEDGSYIWSWEFDESGHAIAEHRTIDDGTLTVVSRQLTWENDCIVEESYTQVIDDEAHDYAMTATCDEQGNPTLLRYSMDGDEYETHELTNEYGSTDLLSRRTGTAISADGDATDIVETFAWQDGWIVQRNYTTTTDEASYDWFTEATADSLGQLVEETIRICTGWGEEDCETSSTTDFSYDAEDHVVSGEGGAKTFLVDDDGNLTTDESFGWTATYAPGEGLLPASAVYTFDEEDVDRWTYSQDCD